MKIIKSLYKINRLKPQKSPKIRDPYMELIQKEKNFSQLRGVYGKDPLKIPLVSLQQDRIASIANKKISLKMGSNIARVRKAINNKYPGGTKSINNPFKKKQAQRMEIKAFKLADLSGKRLQQKLSDKTGIGIRQFGSKATKRNFMPDEKARELGFPESDKSYKFNTSKSATDKIKQLKSLRNKPKYKRLKSNIDSRIKSYKNEIKISDIYKKTNQTAFQSTDPTLTASKQSRVSRLFRGKSSVISKNKMSKKLSMYERKNIYKKQMAFSGTKKDTFALRNYQKFNVFIPKK